jgi:hypothetical protein
LAARRSNIWTLITSSISSAACGSNSSDAKQFDFFKHPNFISPLLPIFSADASFNGIDPQAGRGQGFLPITITPEVDIGNPFGGGGGSRNIQLAVGQIF